MLPNGLNTEHNYLMTIVEEDSEESAGFIWTIHEETEGKKQSFVCDFAIWESKRRRGYATETLRLVEKNAVEAGCEESMLFVADSNDVARALYEKCGYQILRQAGCGKYMIKQLL
ncbi:MAG: GNAT family N-acetyltransferase [Roseburia sp.]|nr:GNAT family N-acetyltransferase [Roseburia sp.]